MNSSPRLLLSLGRKDAAWVCSSCAKSTRQRPSTPFFKPSMRRYISESSKPRQNAVPTMEQLRAPFQKKNSTTMYYAISIILGTVAFSYGSVPMYKMVRHNTHPTNSTKLTTLDLSNHRLWRATYQSTRTWRS
jgi:cytochrome c oxidase assembly protein subunit 11